MSRVITLVMRAWLALVLYPEHAALAHELRCDAQLWPKLSAINDPSFMIQPDVLVELKKVSKTLLNKPAHPVVILGSAGQVHQKDPMFISSREAFKDADHAALLALTYRLTHESIYLKKVDELLVQWAKVNHPTGHPIDETRLDGLIWAYDLVQCDLPEKDRALILAWFKTLRLKKMAWTFAHVTTSNNHRIHQIKMLLLLDNVLDFKKAQQADVDRASYYASLNLNQKSGMSLDYMERSALYYHNYVMQPWLEIALLSDCCRQPIEQGFLFLSQKIKSHALEGEFLHSKANIDALRAQNGFTYAIKGGRFDIQRAAPTVVSYYTLVRGPPDRTLWLIQQQSKPSAKMTFLKIRQRLWHPSLKHAAS